MKIKRFFAKDMRTALNEVKETLGADAVIMSNKKVAEGVELVAAIDSDPVKVKAAPKAAQDTAVFANFLNKYQHQQAATNQNDHPAASAKQNLAGNQQAKSGAIHHFYQQQQQNPAAVDPAIVRHNEQIAAVQQEVGTIRALLEHQLSGLLWQEIERKEPLRAMLIKQLEFMGIAAALAEQLVDCIPADTDKNQAW